ncbi:MAG: hypothetical protein CM15mP83_0340 [Flavobacteriaceae bacterium]|nr:MAG: hypothetical protein CM15mP83_0340 [Flavobacteriaceae bacterium]
MPFTQAMVFIRKPQSFPKFVMSIRSSLLGLLRYDQQNGGQGNSKGHNESCWSTNHSRFRWTNQGFKQCKKLAKSGYPVMLKATAGGGGKGCGSLVRRRPSKAWDSARQEAKASFGNDGCTWKSLLRNHVISKYKSLGILWKGMPLVGKRCSVQRRHQKLTEETPSPFMTDELRENMGKAAVKAAEYIKYEGAGTVEFLVDKHRNFYFMEMNTRIQVEHPITEQVSIMTSLQSRSKSQLVID